MIDSHPHQIMQNMEFRDFLLNENKGYLAQRVADILSAVQDLNDTATNMGTRHLVSNAQAIVNQIRRVIHTHWPQSEEPNLLTLQRCGVVIMKTIDEKGDLVEILKSCQQHLSRISGKNQSPINDLDAAEEPENQN
jgi:hypothetical protein